MAESAIRDKNFSLYFRLASKNSFLEYTPIYQKVLLLGEKLQYNITTFIDKKDYKQALILSDLLYQFTPYQNQASRLKEITKALMLLEYHIHNHTLYDAIKTQDQFQLNANYTIVQELEQQKNHFFEQQLKLITLKQYSQVYANITPYMKFIICKNHIASLMKKCYISQFEDAYKKFDRAIDWEKTFKTYLEFFTLDTLLVKFAKASDKLEILKTIPTHQEILLDITTYPAVILVKLP
ncbi:MAG: hypothetical protein PHR87_06325, partial [Sulfurospirillaceae bacterium]|nr:hypothetical protein [Sulfurospirillaceae bacterium]